MPNKPCRGVEVWQDAFCGDEQTWDAALALYTANKGDPTKYFDYVFAVNSMRKRTQHQVRLLQLICAHAPGMLPTAAA